MDKGFPGSRSASDVLLKISQAGKRGEDKEALLRNL
jgi:hypothetical protein